MKPKIIVLMGLDGSGKTTQAELIARWLNDQGIRSRVVWMRGESYLTRPVLGIGKALLHAPREASCASAACRNDPKLTELREVGERRWQAIIRQLDADVLDPDLQVDVPVL